MANLVNWPPYRAAQVAALQDDVFAYGKNIIDTDLYQGTLDHLEKMAELLEGQETAFFAKFESINSIQDLQAKIDAANRDPGFLAMTSGMVSGIGDEEISNKDLVSAGISWGEMGDVFEMSFRDNDLLEEAMQKMGFDKVATNTVIGAFQEVAPEGATRINRSLGSKSRGFSRRFGSFEIIRGADGKARARVQLEARLSNNWKKRLEHDYNVIFEKLPTQQEKLREWLKKNIKNQELRNCVLYQFDNNLDKYAINRSRAGVQGFLGEVKANAFFHYLTGNPSVSIPSGLTLNERTKEIPIDVVVEGFGFQIKNYTIKEGEVTFSYKQGADSFVRSRMAADGYLADILVAFFGSYTYNKPVAGADAYDSQIYERFRKALSGENDRITDIIDLYLDDIIKVSSIFSSPNSDLFKDRKRWYNTFFLIGSVLVPASKIVWAIREELETERGFRKSIRSVYEFTDTDNTKVDIENNDLSEQGELILPVWPGVGPNIPENMNKTANRVKIKADITLNIPSILSKAVTKAAKS